MYKLIVCLLLFPLLLPAQRSKLDRAQREFDAGDYAGAIRTLQNARGLVDSDSEAGLLLAMSQFHDNKLLEAEESLHEVATREKDNLPLVWFYLGRIYHAQHRFARASVEYKRYLRRLGNDGPERRTTINLLRNCDNGIRAGFLSDEMISENLGETVNTENDEFGPIPSPSGNGRLYFSSVRPEFGVDRVQSDIVYSTGIGNGWSSPAPLSNYINSQQHETLVDISPDGQRLYYFRGSDEKKGAFLVQVFSAEKTTGATTMPVDVPLAAGQGDVTPFFGNGGTVYFASDRPGGYGGLDLYRMDPSLTGYGPPVNLGPNVNGPYDEVTPFLATDGRTLYFSTNDPAYSVGGFDVVRVYEKTGTRGQYTIPENAGMPLNSAGNDTYFRLAPDTFTAFLASDRKDGYGKRDIYIVYFVEPRNEMVVGRR